MADSAGNGNGVLVFFPSYGIMNSCKKCWEDTQVAFKKTLRFEHKDPEKMADIL